MSSGFPTRSDTATEYSFGFSKKRDCTIYVAKTKALISCAVITQLVCAFVFAYANNQFSHAAAQMKGSLNRYRILKDHCVCYLTITGLRKV